MGDRRRQENKKEWKKKRKQEETAGKGEIIRGKGVKE